LDITLQRRSAGHGSQFIDIDAGGKAVAAIDTGYGHEINGAVGTAAIGIAAEGFQIHQVAAGWVERSEAEITVAIGGGAGDFAGRVSGSGLHFIGDHGGADNRLAPAVHRAGHAGRRVGRRVIGLGRTAGEQQQSGQQPKRASRSTETTTMFPHGHPSFVGQGPMTPL